MSPWNEMHIFHACLNTTRIRNGHQTTTVTTTSHRLCENDCYSGPTRNSGNVHQNRARCCEINIRDAFREPVSPLSRRNETHLFPRVSAFSRVKETCAFNLRPLYLDERARSWGPLVRTGNGILHCPLHCWHVRNGLSVTTPSEIILYYRLNHSVWSLSNNKESSCWVSRSKPGKSLETHPEDRNICIKTPTKESLECLTN
jgi:hypothetical protein